jgi:predicted DNA binding CopG/RHH family protein
MVKTMAALIGGAKIPEFESEAAEALWWDEHRAEVEENLRGAIRGGSAQLGTAQRLTREARASKNVTIRMPLADLERARQLSSKKGLGYQTYVKMLLHEALDREEKHGAA